MSLNQIALQGRMTKDPELRYTQSQKPVVTFTLAVDRDFAPAGEDRGTDFIQIIAWQKTAEFISKNFSKGSAAIVTGRLQMREWTDRDGNKRTAAEVIADRVYFGEAKRRDAEEAPETQSRFRELNGDGETPF